MRSLALTAALAGLLGLGVGPGSADEPARAIREPARTIRVVGQGRASAAPDLAVVHTGVMTEAATAAEALAANTKAMTKVLEVVKNAQVAAKDVQTSQLQVQPVYEQNPQARRTPPAVVAYRVTNVVAVRVRDVSKLGAVLDALVQAGSNQLSGIAFDLDDPSAALTQARERAFADARRRAETYASAAKVRVGRVVTISEEPTERPRFVPVARAVGAAGGGAVPVEAGENEFHAEVHVVFELEDRPG
jgi:uncharacterized protein YggE